MKRHHPFCNYFAFGEPEECKMCKNMNERYPLKEGETGLDLIRKHFPEAVVIGEENESKRG